MLRQANKHHLRAIIATEKSQALTHRVSLPLSCPLRFMRAFSSGNAGLGGSEHVLIKKKEDKVGLETVDEQDVDS